MRWVRLAAVVLLGAHLASACAPQPLVARAIRARGGPLANLVRRAEAEVFAGFPATWRWRTAFLGPDRYAWTIETTGEATHYLLDGGVVRAFIGTHEVALDSARDAPLRSHARFTAVANLDVLMLPGSRTQVVPPDALPPDTAVALDVVFADDGARYRLGFDSGLHVVSVEGPLSLAPFGSGRVTARFSEFREVGRRVLPYRTRYGLTEEPVADERTLAACPNVAALDASSFERPDLLPDCP